jgi:hypothetical protein
MTAAGQPERRRVKPVDRKVHWLTHVGVIFTMVVVGGSLLLKIGAADEKVRTLEGVQAELKEDVEDIQDTLDNHSNALSRIEANDQRDRATQIRILDAIERLDERLDGQ